MNRLPALVSKPARSPHAQRDAERLLAAGPCAVCTERDDAAHRWLRYFTHHSRAEARVQTRIRSSMGFCPPHTRHLLGDPASASWLLPQLYDLALDGGLQLLTGPARRPAPHACPACVTGTRAAARARSVLLRALDRPPVFAAMTGGDVCLPHLAAAAASLPAEEGVRLAEAVVHRFPERAALEWIAGSDADAPVRARLHRALDPLADEEDRRQQRSVLDRWDADAGLACCPLCLAEHRAARRLLRWAAWAGPEPPDGEDTALCARHLHDLAADGGPNLAVITAGNAAAWQARFTRFHLLRRQGGAARRTAPERLLYGPDTRGCRACREEALAARRQRDLLTAVLYDATRARAYETAHGICLRHAMSWPDPPAPVFAALRARTALLRWELDEALRKQEWHTRHEVRGAELGVGLRAPTLVDGRVYAGLPPQPRVH
ncbi:hypothetical protein G5C51_11555, partial [Streptomyces sp. A7024]